MEEKRSSLSVGLTVLISVGIVICFILIILHIVNENKRNKEAVTNTTETSIRIDRLNDSTYHVNFGDGSSCLTMEKIEDSLSLRGVNIFLITVYNDTITVDAKQKESGHRMYDLAYKDFFDGPTPYNRKIGFSLN